MTHHTDTPTPTRVNRKNIAKLKNFIRSERTKFNMRYWFSLASQNCDSTMPGWFGVDSETYIPVETYTNYLCGTPCCLGGAAALLKAIDEGPVDSPRFGDPARYLRIDFMDEAAEWLGLELDIAYSLFSPSGFDHQLWPVITREEALIALDRAVEHSEAGHVTTPEDIWSHVWGFELESRWLASYDRELRS